MAAIVQGQQTQQAGKLLWFINKPGWMSKKPKQAAAPTSGEDVSIQVFDSVGWVDRRLLWIFEIVSSLAVILLAVGLVTSQTNVQTHGAILTNNVTMQYAWAWTQNIAIDMSLLGAIIRACVYWMEKEYKKALLYSVLAVLLLFTAFIVSDVEAMYQSVQNISIDAAWGKLPLVSIELLTSIRSFAVVLLLVAHATQYVGWYQAKYHDRKIAAQTLSKPVQAVQVQATQAVQPTQTDLEKILEAMSLMNAQNMQAIQAMNAQTMQVTIEQATKVSVEAVKQSLEALPFTQPLQIVSPIEQRSIAENATVASPAPFLRDYKSEIETLLTANPDITEDEVMRLTGCSKPTAIKWLSKLQPQH